MICISPCSKRVKNIYKVIFCNFLMPNNRVSFLLSYSAKIILQFCNSLTSLDQVLEAYYGFNAFVLLSFSSKIYCWCVVILYVQNSCLYSLYRITAVCTSEVILIQLIWKIKIPHITSLLLNWSHRSESKY